MDGRDTGAFRPPPPPPPPPTAWDATRPTCHNNRVSHAEHRSCDRPPAPNKNYENLHFAVFLLLNRLLSATILNSHFPFFAAFFFPILRTEARYKILRFQHTTEKIWLDDKFNELCFDFCFVLFISVLPPLPPAATWSTRYILPGMVLQLSSLAHPAPPS